MSPTVGIDGCRGSRTGLPPRLDLATRRRRPVPPIDRGTEAPRRDVRNLEVGHQTTENPVHSGLDHVPGRGQVLGGWCRCGRRRGRGRRRGQGCGSRHGRRRGHDIISGVAGHRDRDHDRDGVSTRRLVRVRVHERKVVTLLDGWEQPVELPVSERNQGQPLRAGLSRRIRHRKCRENRIRDRHARHRVDGRSGRRGDPVGEQRAGSRGLRSASAGSRSACGGEIRTGRASGTS